MLDVCIKVLSLLFCRFYVYQYEYYYSYSMFISLLLASCLGTLASMIYIQEEVTIRKVTHPKATVSKWTTWETTIFAFKFSFLWEIKPTLKRVTNDCCRCCRRKANGFNSRDCQELLFICIEFSMFSFARFSLNISFILSSSF